MRFLIHLFLVFLEKFKKMIQFLKHVFSKSVKTWVQIGELRDLIDMMTLSGYFTSRCYYRRKSCFSSLKWCIFTKPWWYNKSKMSKERIYDDTDILDKAVGNKLVKPVVQVCFSEFVNNKPVVEVSPILINPNLWTNNWKNDLLSYGKLMSD